MMQQVDMFAVETPVESDMTEIQEFGHMIAVVWQVAPVHNQLQVHSLTLMYKLQLVLAFDSLQDHWASEYNQQFGELHYSFHIVEQLACKSVDVLNHGIDSSIGILMAYSDS